MYDGRRCRELNATTPATPTRTTPTPNQKPINLVADFGYCRSLVRIQLPRPNYEIKSNTLRSAPILPLIEETVGSPPLSIWMRRIGVGEREFGAREYSLYRVVVAYLA
jgi:hypothetical protein